MLAIAYVLVMIALGDLVTRRFFPALSLVHRASAAFLVGLLLATWIAYLAAAVFAGLDRPLLVGNIGFFAVALVLLRSLPRRLTTGIAGGGAVRMRAALVREWPEIVVLTGLLPVAGWLAVSTFGVDGGQLLLGDIVYSDFGSTTAISQSFAVGSNFPTVYPHFAGEAIRYHFLLYFQAGNLTFLGMDPALSLNVLSVLSLGAMLGMVVTLGRILFGSAAVACIGAALFLVHGSLAWIAHVVQQPSIGAALADLPDRREFLTSGFPFRGEDWGVWSMAVYANQRHFASGIGVLLLVLAFLIARWKIGDRPVRDVISGIKSARLPSLRGGASSLINPLRQGLEWPDILSFSFAGLVLGALPMWNGAVFVASFAILATLFILMPDRRYMLFLAAFAALAALPQLEFLRPSAGANADFPAFRWG